MMFILHTIQANVTKNPITCLSTRQLTYNPHPKKGRKSTLFRLCGPWARAVSCHSGRCRWSNARATRGGVIFIPGFAIQPQPRWIYLPHSSRNPDKHGRDRRLILVCVHRTCKVGSFRSTRVVLIVLMMFILHTIQANVTKNPSTCLSTRQLTYNQTTSKNRKEHPPYFACVVARLVL